MALHHTIFIHLDKPITLKNEGQSGISVYNGDDRFNDLYIFAHEDDGDKISRAIAAFNAVMSEAPAAPIAEAAE